MQILTAALLLTRQGRHLPGTWQHGTRGGSGPLPVAGRPGARTSMGLAVCLRRLPCLTLPQQFYGGWEMWPEGRKEKAPEWLYLEALAAEVSLRAVPQAAQP